MSDDGGGGSPPPVDEGEQQLPEDDFAGLPAEEEEFVDGDGDDGDGSGEGADGSGEGADGSGEGADGGGSADGGGGSGEGGDGEEAGEGEEAEPDGDSVDSSEEEGGSEENEYEADGFVVDEDAEGDEGEASAGGEPGADGRGGRRGRRKKRRRQSFALDEEDYELLEDNQIKVKRPEERKRLKRRGDEHEKAAGAKQLQEALFGTGDLEDELADLAPGPEGGGEPGGGEPGGDGARRPRYDEYAEDISDEMDDFIVDGEDGERRRARRRRDARVAQAAGLSTAAVQAANRLFGNFGELLDLHQSHRLFDGAPDDDDEGSREDSEALEEGDALDDDDAERRRTERHERREAKRQAKLLAQVDPDLVDSHFLRPADATIRTTDVPERLQLLGRSAMESLAEDERRPFLEEAARWVADQLFGEHSTSSKIREVVEDGVLEVTGEYTGPPARRDGGSASGSHLWPPWLLQDVERDAWLDLRNNRAVLARRGARHPSVFHNTREGNGELERRLLDQWRRDPVAQEGLRKAVQTVLEGIFERHEEVPLQAMFRKEGCGELLSLRATDAPETTGNEAKTQSEPDVRHPRGTMQPRHRRIRRWDVLWAVFNAGVRFMDLYRRRKARIDVYNRMYEAAATDAERDGIAACHAMLTSVMHTGPSMDDIDAKFRRVLDATNAFERLSLEAGGGGGGSGGGGSGGGARKPKRPPGRPSLLRRWLQFGLGDAARLVALPMHEFQENMEKHEARFAPEDPELPPEEWAAAQIQERGLDAEEERSRVGDLATPQGFLRAVTEVLAGELAAEPCLRKLARNEVYSAAELTTRPTPAGEDVLDPFHPCGIAKHLVGKKVRDLEGSDTWLRVITAERAGLIKVELSVSDKQLNAMVQDVSDLYLTDNLADVSQAWNEWRRGVLHAALRGRLLPAMLQELRGTLTARATEAVLGQVQDRFWHFVSQPPVRLLDVPEEQDAEPVPLERPRFMVIVWGSGGPGDGPTTVVQLDGSGQLKDLLTAAQLSGNVPRTVNSGSKEQPVFDPAADPKKKRDSIKLRDKILEHKPNAILVASSAPQSKQLKDDMEKISQYTESDARFKEQLLPHLENKRVEVLWADDQLAALWANSEAAAAEFPDYSYLVRKAVGVGRLSLDPLAVVAALCGPRRDVLSLKLHDLQASLPRDALVTRLEQTLITAVAQVGVDINAVVANPWRQAPLQFVPGLGPRKARALLGAIAGREESFIKERVDLLRQDAAGGFGLAPGDVAQLGPRVFSNAAPFLRVRRGDVGGLANEEELNALDDARVHPENEALLQVILEEAYPDQAEAGSVEVAKAIEAPQNLQQLDLYAVAEANNHLFKLPTLVDMLFELLAPYGEVRLSSATPSDEDAFFLRHGETRESLRPGRLVDAKVVWVGETEVKVVIQNNGMEAIIPQAHVSSANSAPQLSALFRPGQVVKARIMDTEQVDSYDENMRRRYTVTLSTASAFLNDHDTWEAKYCCARDKAYRPPDRAAAAAAAAAAQAAAAAATPSRRAAKVPLQARPIEHPLWRNKSAAEAGHELAELPPGSALFRPARKPTLTEQLAHVGLSIKLAQLPTGPLLLHLDLKEAANKPPRQKRLVPPLRLEMPAGLPAESYEDLDEVVARYVEPVAELAQQVLQHRKFQPGGADAIRDTLRLQLAQQPAARDGAPAAGVYCLALDASRPGNGVIHFGAGGATAGLYSEHFGLLPGGLYFRRKLYPSVEHMLAAFKRDPNYKKQQHAAAAGGGYGPPPMQQPPQPPQLPYPQQLPQPAHGGGGYVPQHGGVGSGGGYAPQPQRPPQGPYGGPLPAPAAAAAAAPAAPPGGGGGYGAPMLAAAQAAAAAAGAASGYTRVQPAGPGPGPGPMPPRGHAMPPPQQQLPPPGMMGHPYAPPGPPGPPGGGYMPAGGPPLPGPPPPGMPGGGMPLHGPPPPGGPMGPPPPMGGDPGGPGMRMPPPGPAGGYQPGLPPPPYPPNTGGYQPQPQAYFGR